MLLEASLSAEDNFGVLELFLVFGWSVRAWGALSDAYLWLVCVNYARCWNVGWWLQRTNMADFSKNVCGLQKAGLGEGRIRIETWLNAVVALLLYSND